MFLTSAYCAKAKLTDVPSYVGFQGGGVKLTHSAKRRETGKE
jgi:hypothetical protein